MSKKYGELIPPKDIKLPDSPVTDGELFFPDGDLMLEVNAISDKFCLTFQVYGGDRKPLEAFCKILDGEKIPYTVSDRYTRYLPKVEFPQV